MIFFVFLFPFLVFAQDFTEKRFTLGTRSSFFFNETNWDNSFLYYVPEYADETFGDSVGQKRKLKLRVFDFTSSNEKVVVDPLDVSIEFFTDKNSFQVGFLRYRFSETFGVQFLDVANPRDYSEFVFNDLSWSKRSVFGINDTYKWNDLQIQLILTLWPNGDRLPYQGSPFDPTGSQVDYQGGVVTRPWFKDFEYGTRFKYLFESGVDLSFLYYHHFSRPTFQDIKVVTPTEFKAISTDHLVDSFGTAGSFVWKEWVLRADALYTLNDLVQKNALFYQEKDHFQVLAGVDRNFEEFVLGLQTQGDFTTDRHFFGARAEYSSFTWWKPSLMIFRSYTEDDQWLQVKNMLEMEDWKFTFVYDNIHGGKEDSDLFGFYRNQDRLLVDVSYTY